MPLLTVCQQIIRYSKFEISNIIQSGGSFGSWLGNLEKETLTNNAFPLARDNLQFRDFNFYFKQFNFKCNK